MADKKAQYFPGQAAARKDAADTANFQHENLKSASESAYQALLDFIQRQQKEAEEKNKQPGAQANQPNFYFNAISIDGTKYKVDKMPELTEALKKAPKDKPVTICFEGQNAAQNCQDFLNAFAKNQDKTVIFENVNNINKQNHEDNNVCYYCVSNKQNVEITYGQVKDIFNDKDKLNKLLDAVELQKNGFQDKPSLDDFITKKIADLNPPAAAARPHISQ